MDMYLFRNIFNSIQILKSKKFLPQAWW